MPWSRPWPGWPARPDKNRLRNGRRFGQAARWPLYVVRTATLRSPSEQLLLLATFVGQAGISHFSGGDGIQGAKQGEDVGWDAASV